MIQLMASLKSWTASKEQGLVEIIVVGGSITGDPNPKEQLERFLHIIK